MRESIKLWLAEPEAYALRKIAWQFFVTLTFAGRVPGSKIRISLVFAWLRDVARCTGSLHFLDLLWVFRYEIGKGGRGHFHLCIAGMPARAIGPDHRYAYESLWSTRTRGLAAVAAYDPARDGVGYMLKTPPRAIQNRAVALSSGRDAGEPTLSKSVLALLRRR